MKTAEEILIEIANDESYDTWYELMYDTHANYQLEITKKAMYVFAKQLIEEALPFGYHAAKDEAKGISSNGYATAFYQKYLSILPQNDDQQ